MARSKEGKGEVMVFTVRSRIDGKDKTVVYSHCKHSGHEVEPCFALIRYPDWWGDRPRHDAKVGGRGKGQQPSSQQ